MTQPGSSTSSSRRRYTRGLLSGLALVVGSTSLLFVVARYSEDGPALLVRALQVLGVSAALLGLALFALALSLRSHRRLSELLAARQDVRAVAYAGTSTTLRKELKDLTKSGYIDAAYTSRFPLYFCAAVESNCLSLWVLESGEPARIAQFPWNEVEKIDLAPIRDGNRDFWGFRIEFRRSMPPTPNSAQSVSLLLRGGGPGGIFGVSQREAQEIVAIAQMSREKL